MTELSRNALTEAENNLDLAKKIWANLSGANSQHSGICITLIGTYLIVEDGGDTWLTTVEDYQEALDRVIGKAISGTYTADEAEDEAYTDLCSILPALFSVNGDGDYNDRVPELIRLLKADCPELVDMLRDKIDISQIDVKTILEQLGITQDANT